MNKKCIFCGGSGKKSKEHIWSEWMHDYLPKMGDGYNLSEVHTSKWDEHLDSTKSKRQGHLYTKKLRVVCESCNSGWMSVLESKVKPILIPIFQNKTFEISNEEKISLAKWIAMKAIVGENSVKNTHVTPFADRTKLKDLGEIPSYFCIYIGVHSEKFDSAWLRTSITLSLSKSGPVPPLGNRNRNSQSIGMIFGPLFAFVLAIRHDNIDPATFIRFTKIRRIYPDGDLSISWPPEKVLSNNDMGTIVYALDDLNKMPNVFYGGDIPKTNNT
jgi:hypothetical protein